jgi:mRNA interferase MazF
MARPAPGEVWRVDLGLTAKVRPCLVTSEYPAENELALVLIVPHTTALRGSRWEFVCPNAFLKPEAFHLQQLQPVSLPKLQSRLGTLNAEEFRGLRQRLTALLRLNE